MRSFLIDQEDLFESSVLLRLKAPFISVTVGQVPDGGGGQVMDEVQGHREKISQ